MAARQLFMAIRCLILALALVVRWGMAHPVCNENTHDFKSAARAVQGERL